VPSGRVCSAPLASSISPPQIFDTVRHRSGSTTSKASGQRSILQISRCHHGARHHFRGSSSILSPPLATGTTQTDVASTSATRVDLTAALDLANVGSGR
jgi:hypothetical protein